MENVVIKKVEDQDAFSITAGWHGEERVYVNLSIINIDSEQTELISIRIANLLKEIEL